MKNFPKLTARISRLVGSPWAFIIALALIAIWGISGSVFGYSDTWQLIINTATTIITFLVVFLIQNTQNRDTKSIHIQLSELIRAIKGARNKLMDLEDFSDEEMEKLHQELRRLQNLRDKVHKGKNRSFKHTKH